MRLSLPALLLFAGASCAGAEDSGRDAILVEWFQRDNAAWLSRDPALLAGKYERMAADPYDFMRGTSGLFHEDVARLHADRPETTFEGAVILVLADPHPENLSTHYPGVDVGPAVGEGSPELVLAWADFDAATWGSWTTDLRRAALGLTLFVGGLEGCDADCQDGAVAGLARGYAETLAHLEAGEPTWRVEDALYGNPLVGVTLLEALEEGSSRKRLRGNTVDDDGPIRFTATEGRPESLDGLGKPTPSERAVADRILARYAASRDHEFRVLDVARRYGQGVSSFPATRFVVLWDEGDDGPGDDQLLNVREILDPPPVSALAHATSPTWAHNAHRVEDATRTLWPEPDLDPDMDTVVDGPASWKLLGWDSWYQGLSHDDAAEVWQENSDPAVAAELGRGIGFALADAHARSRTPSGEPALPVLLADLNGQSETLAQELVSTARADRARTLEDHARFISLLDRLGPWLGADRFGEAP